MIKGLNVVGISQKKKEINSIVALNPLPIPIVRFSKDHQPQWPTNEIGCNVHFSGRFDYNERCVFIEDTCSIYMLSKMGSFGKHINNLLVLDLCEAYFLSYALGCLTVMDAHLDLLWEKFAKAYNPHDSSKFPIMYAVYHYFRSKGWIVRSGSQFGTSFLLYKEGPAYYHANYAVQVVDVYQDTTSSLYDWQSLLSVNRILQSASKGLLITNVILSEINDFSNPKCVKRFKLRTQLLSRWQPKILPNSDNKVAPNKVVPTIS